MIYLEKSIRFDDLIGKSFEEAQDMLLEYDILLRQWIVDGEKSRISAFFDSKRLNVELSGGKIVKIIGYG